MAKAKPKASTGGEIWFNDAVALLAGTWGSAAVAEQVLVDALKADDKADRSWSHKLPDGTRVPGDTAFFNDLFVTVVRGENRAFISAPIEPIAPATSSSAVPNPDTVPAAVYAIKVARTVVMALMPAEALAGDDLTATAVWVANEARRLKQAGKIPANIRISKLARDLADNMRAAADTDSSIRPVGWRHIKNMLSTWGLWPTSSIK